VQNLILGGSAFGNLYKEVSEEVTEETMRYALNLGVRFFDTAPHYGAGLSEERFGKLLMPFLKDVSF